MSAQIEAAQAAIGPSGLTMGRRARLIVEMLTLYIGAPLIIYYLVKFQRVPLLYVLPPVAIMTIVFLTIDKTFSWARMFGAWPRGRDILRILGLFLILGSAMTIFTYVVYPELFLSLPKNRPQIWLMILVFYPLLSAATQEIVYRVFFFHRYDALFESRPWLAVLTNAVLFSFSHIIFQHWISLVLTFIGGLIFAARFQKTRTFWTVAFEHSLYGDLIFTVGLGRFFFTGVSGFRA